MFYYLRVNQLAIMAAHEIEIILSRQLADCLSLPVFITDPAGNLIFYNEPAELLLGKRYEETGEMPVDLWATVFKPLDENENPMAPDELPLVKTLKNLQPYHNVFFIHSMAGVRSKISATSFPIIGRAGNFLGAVAIFWALEEK